MEGASTHIICNGEEIVRTKIRDTLLRCLQKLWPKHLHTSCNLSFFHISATWPEPAFLNVSVRTFRWNTYFTKKELCALCMQRVYFFWCWPFGHFWWLFWNYLCCYSYMLQFVIEWLSKKKSYDNRIFWLLNFFFFGFSLFGGFVCLFGLFINKF